MSTNENIIYTIKDFHIAFKELKENQNLSLGQIAIKTGLSKSFLSDIMNNKVLPPKDEFIEKIAKALGVGSDYFFEYRLRRLNDLIKKNRGFLSYCIKGSLSYQKNNKT